MKKSQLKKILNSIVVYWDTREKKNQHILDDLENMKIKTEKKKLGSGDYSFFLPANEDLGVPEDIDFSNKCIIERKASLEELSNNLTFERDRFKRELERAPDSKVLLIENSTYEQLFMGEYNTKMSSNAFLSTLHTFWVRYSCPFIFIPSELTALFIVGHFKSYLKEYINETF